MNLAAQIEPDCAMLSRESEATGILVVEQRSTTPLGPRIVYANEVVSRLSGYENASLVGSPLGLIYDRTDLATLIGKLPLIAVHSSHCFMDRVLLRNGETRLPCRWTIRPTNREGEPRGHFALTVRPAPLPGEESPAPGEPLEAAPVSAAVRADSLADKATSPVDQVVSPDPAGLSPEVDSGSHEVSPPAPAAPAEPRAREFEAVRDESISLAAAGVAHDFKNALQAIKMNLELASLAVPHEDRARDHLAEAQLALDDAEMLARQMLAFTRGESGRRGVIRLGHLLERVSRLCSAGSGIRCRLRINEDLKCVEGDATRIYQVLHNLVINARQSMPTGGTIDIIAANAAIDAENPYAVAAGDYVVVSVTDKGCGIPAEDLPRIFDSSYSTKAGGSGIGLASCQAIVQAHRGAIRVASRVGVGTEFLVFLPSTDQLPDADPAWVKPASPKNGGPLRNSASGRILVVEDQPGVARSTLGMLKQLGYETLHARNGEEALTQFREHFDSLEPVDAVLLDMTLPGGLPGREVAVELRRIDPGARIVATSGYFEEGAEIALAGEFAGVLPKPYGMGDLSEALGRAVA